MSEAVSSDHDPNSRLPEANQPQGTPVKQEELTSQQSNKVASGESLQGAMHETHPLGIADWQPVEFPDAISLTQLSHPAFSKSELTQSKALDTEDPRSDLRNLVAQLRQENSAFRVQVSQLERDLTQAQVELQLEVTRFYCKEAEAAISQSESLTEIAAQSSLSSQELAAIHQQISQLSQELDLSQKMGHRQQILVETLSEQLESGQERIAHLERDCAITQQRYNEQVQLVLQAENVCRDLRMRLHRQQRQALQFKAALEKSLEMGSMQGGAIAQSDVISPSAVDVTPFTPKVQSVQPWSQVAPAGTPGYANCRSNGTVLPNLLAKLLPTDQQSTAEVEMTPIQEVELPPVQAPMIINEGINEANQSEGGVAGVLVSSVEAASTVPAVITSDDVSQYMSLIFPKQVDSSPQSAAVTLVPSEAIFDLSPFLEEGEADSIGTPAVELRPIAKNILPPLLHPPRPKQSVVPQKTSGEAPLQSSVSSQSSDREDNLWADLAKLIEPDLLVDESSSPSDLSNPIVEQVSVPANPFESAAELMRNEQSDQEPIQSVKEPNKGDSPSAKPLSLDFFAYIEKKSNNAPQPEALNTPKPEPKSVNANLSHFEKKSAAPEETLEPLPSRPHTSENKSIPCPSPILYPFRPAKKLKSMSAVDLPSFR
ncbi:hypothetical protein AB3R30_02510 [Leptolyngbyaceae cyanobacterium UHCC 1019]